MNYGPYLASRQLLGGGLPVWRGAERHSGLPVLLYLLPHAAELPAVGGALLGYDHSGEQDGQAYAVTHLPPQAAPPRVLLQAAIGALDVLSDLHAQGYWHGGMHPSQLWVSHDTVRVAGFGLPWASLGDGDAPEGGKGPEQDVYALGVALCEIGRLPEELSGMLEADPARRLTAAQSLAAARALYPLPAAPEAVSAAPGGSPDGTVPDTLVPDTLAPDILTSDTGAEDGTLSQTDPASRPVQPTRWGDESWRPGPQTQRHGTVPPQGMPSQGMPSQGLPPQGMPSQGLGPRAPLAAAAAPGDLASDEWAADDRAPDHPDPNHPAPAPDLPAPDGPAFPGPGAQAVSEMRFPVHETAPPAPQPGPAAAPSAAPRIRVGFEEDHSWRQVRSPDGEDAPAAAGPAVSGSPAVRSVTPDAPPASERLADDLLRGARPSPAIGQTLPGGREEYGHAGRILSPEERAAQARSGGVLGRIGAALSGLFGGGDARPKETVVRAQAQVKGADGRPARPPSRRPGWLPLALALLLALLIALLVWTLWPRGERYDLNFELQGGAPGDVVVLEVVRAPVGSRLRAGDELGEVPPGRIRVDEEGAYRLRAVMPGTSAEFELQVPQDQTIPIAIRR